MSRLGLLLTTAALLAAVSGAGWGVTTLTGAAFVAPGGTGMAIIERLMTGVTALGAVGLVDIVTTLWRE